MYHVTAYTLSLGITCPNFSILDAIMNQKYGGTINPPKGVFVPGGFQYRFLRKFPEAKKKIQTILHIMSTFQNNMLNNEVAKPKIGRPP